MTRWEFERHGEIVRVDPTGPLIVRVGTATDLAVAAAIAGSGIVYLFEDWLRPHFESGRLTPVLEPWWPAFSGPFLYYPGRRLLPAPLRAFIDFTIKDSAIKDFAIKDFAVRGGPWSEPPAVDEAASTSPTSR